MPADGTSLRSERTSRRIVLISGDRVLRSVLTSAMGAGSVEVLERPGDLGALAGGADVLVLDVPGAEVAAAVRELRRGFGGRLVVLADRGAPGFELDDRIRVVERPYTTTQLLRSIGGIPAGAGAPSRGAGEGSGRGRERPAGRQPGSHAAAPLLTSPTAHAPRAGAGSNGRPAKPYRPHAQRNRALLGAAALIAVVGVLAWVLVTERDSSRSTTGSAVRSVPLDCSIPLLKDKYWVDARGVASASPVGSVLDFGSAPTSIGTLLFAPGGTSKWQRYRAVLVVRHPQGQDERIGGLVVLARSRDELRIGVSRKHLTIEGPSLATVHASIDPSLVHEIDVTVKTDAAVVKVDGVTRLTHTLTDRTSAGGIGLFSDAGSGAAPSFDLLRIDPLVTACTS